MAPSSSVRLGSLHDEYDDYDDYYDGYGPVPDPGYAPIPASDPVPTPDPGPVPLTIGIVGLFGSDAFTPNPLQASVGDMIVWTNNDTVTHHIVLADGTVIGDLAPGASSAAMPLLTPTATYQCMIHPTTVGGINGAEVAAEPPIPPPDEIPEPPPDEIPEPPPVDYY